MSWRGARLSLSLSAALWCFFWWFSTNYGRADPFMCVAHARGPIRNAAEEERVCVWTHRAACLVRQLEKFGRSERFGVWRTRRRQRIVQQEVSVCRSPSETSQLRCNNTHLMPCRLWHFDLWIMIELYYFCTPYNVKDVKCRWGNTVIKRFCRVLLPPSTVDVIGFQSFRVFKGLHVCLQIGVRSLRTHTLSLNYMYTVSVCNNDTVVLRTMINRECLLTTFPVSVE